MEFFYFFGDGVGMSVNWGGRGVSRIRIIGFIIMRMQGCRERSLGLHQHYLDNIGEYGGYSFAELWD